MAPSVIHDVNNALNTILSAAFLIDKKDYCEEVRGRTCTRCIDTQCKNHPKYVSGKPLIN
jgi:hypothetical protein